MSLYEEIAAQLKTALKTKNKTALNALRGLRAVIKNKEVELRRKLEDAEIVQLVAKQIKQRQDSIEQFKRGNRFDLVEKETQEIEILKQFLPPPLSEAELEQLLRQMIAEVGATGLRDMGKVMKKAMSQVQGRAEGKVVSEMVKRLLASL
ncbi:MAG: GatB/YqeY domain-containing protein [Candidatus Desulfofervidaceae bacterium]|nr:GatB/YqeY domain-containing protein [Candidatus Desulfofervidaceae bacterium]